MSQPNRESHHTALFYRIVCGQMKINKETSKQKGSYHTNRGEMGVFFRPWSQPGELVILSSPLCDLIEGPLVLAVMIGGLFVLATSLKGKVSGNRLISSLECADITLGFEWRMRSNGDLEVVVSDGEGDEG